MLMTWKASREISIGCQYRDTQCLKQIGQPLRNLLNLKGHLVFLRLPWLMKIRSLIYLTSSARLYWSCLYRMGWLRLRCKILDLRRSSKGGTYKRRKLKKRRKRLKKSVRRTI